MSNPKAPIENMIVFVWMNIMTTVEIVKKYKKRSCSSELSLALRQYSETSKRKMELMKRVVTSSAPASHDGTSTKTHFHLQKESVSALDKIKGIGGDSYATAIDKFQHELWRVLLFEMSEKRRKDLFLNLNETLDWLS